MENKPANQNTRLAFLKDSEAGKMLGSRYRSFLIAAANALSNLRVTVPISDGTNIVSSKDADIKVSDLGMVITLPPMGLPGSGGGTSIAAIQQFKIVSDGGDYWVCKTWDGTTLGSTAINVAKPFKLRSGTGGIASEVIRGVTYTYTYSAVTVGAVTGYYTRAVSGSDGSSETNYTIPDPIASDIIYGVTFETLSPSTLTAVVWFDINADGRAWAL